MKWLWPIQTGKTFFDLWSLVHFAFWFVVGADIWALKAAGKVKGLLIPLAISMILALVWEIIERFGIEAHGLVAFPERWFNRWLSDPLMCLLGVLVGWLLLRHQ